MKSNMKTKIEEFEVLIPSLDGNGIAERVKIPVTVEWDEEVKEWLMTPEAHEIIENTKARLIGLLLPEQFAELRKRYNYTQQQMGELFQAGEKSWNRWETGNQRPSRMVNLLIRALYEGEISIAYLLRKADKSPAEIHSGLHLDILWKSVLNIHNSPYASQKALVEFTDNKQSRYRWLIAKEQQGLHEPALLSGIQGNDDTADASNAPAVPACPRMRDTTPSEA